MIADADENPVGQSPTQADQSGGEGKTDLESRLQETAQEAKRYRQELAAAREQLKKAEDERTKATLSVEERAKRAEETAAKREQELRETQARFAYQSVSDQVRAEAARMGVVDDELLLAVFDLKKVDIDENFRPDTASIRRELESLAKSKPVLFSRNAAQPKDAAPRGTQQPQKKDPKSMTMTERWAEVERLAKLNKK